MNAGGRAAAGRAEKPDDWLAVPSDRAATSLPPALQVGAQGTGARHASVLSLLLLGAVVGLGLAGVFGNQVANVSLAGQAVQAWVQVPARVRAGQVLETRIQLLAKDHIGELALGVEPSLWRELTTTAIVPQPSAQRFEAGRVVLVFGRVERGTTWVLQVSQQVNPGLTGRNRGRLVLLDGQRELARAQLTLEVLP